MKRFLARAGAALCLLGAATAASAITISVVPASQDVTVGSLVSVGIAVADLVDGAAPSLGAYDLDFSFDPSVLSFTGAVFGDPLLGNQLDLFNLGSINGVTPGAGLVNLFEISLDLAFDLDSLQAGSFTLATLSFNAIAEGISLLGLTINALGDSLGDPLVATVAGGSVNVRPAIAVSEPPALSMLLISLLAAGAMRLRGRASLRRVAGQT